MTLAKAYIYTNGQVMAFSDTGIQIPELQGTFGEVGAQLAKAATTHTKVYFADWGAGEQLRLLPDALKKMLPEEEK